jgi:hypothetical protein
LTLSDRPRSVHPRGRNTLPWLLEAHCGLHLPGTGSDEPGPVRAAEGASSRLQYRPDSIPSSVRPDDSRLRTSSSKYIPGLDPDRRRTPRKSAISLRPWERQYLRDLVSQTGRCETGTMTIARALPGASSVRGERLTFRPRCCSRGCVRCDGVRRERQAARCEGPWRLFVTVGVPRGPWSCREAWMQFSGWATSLMARIRDHARRGSSGDVRVCYPFRARHEALQARADPFTRGPSLIRYAWVVEPHRSGWPHLHAVLSCDYIDQGWLKRVWGEIVGAPLRWCKIRRVTDASGVCRYLSKYLSKTQLPLDILAAMGRNRMWACTLPVRSVPGSGWRIIPPDSRGLLFSNLTSPRPDESAYGWRVSSSRDQVYCLEFIELSYSAVAPYLPEAWYLPDSVTPPFAHQSDLCPTLQTLVHAMLDLDPSGGFPLSNPRNRPEPKPPSSPFGARFAGAASSRGGRRIPRRAFRSFVEAARRGSVAACL